MKDRIKTHLTTYAQKHGWGTGDAELIEILMESPVLGKQDEDEHRWWVEYTCFVDIEGMIIGFTKAKSTGDMSAHEAGWEFDKDSVFEAEKYTETVTKFRMKK